MNFPLTRSSSELRRKSQHPLLTSSHCFNFLSCLSWPLPPHRGARQTSSALRWPFQYHPPGPSGAQFSGVTAPGFPSYGTSSHRVWLHLPRSNTNRQELTLAGAFMPYAFAKTYTTTAGHSAATRQKHTSQWHRPPQDRAPRSFCRKKNHGNFKMVTEVAWITLCSLNLRFFRLTKPCCWLWGE